MLLYYAEAHAIGSMNELLMKRITMFLKLEIGVYVLAAGVAIGLDIASGCPSFAGALAAIQFIFISAWSAVMFKAHEGRLDRIQQEIHNSSAPIGTPSS